MPKRGQLTVIYGPMFAGKTGKLVAMVEVFTKMGFKVITLKPLLDQRYSQTAEIHSHDHRTSQAVMVDGESVDGIVGLVKEHQAQKIIIDEAQFFAKEKILAIVDQLLSLGLDVFAAGLLYDYRRRPFGAMPDLLGLADEKLELVAVCQKCGAIARHSERIDQSQQTIEVGAADKYLAVCEKCHQINE